MLSDAIFSTIVANTPLISIDLIVRNKNGEVLLGKRNNRPAQDMWFVPGGRIFKAEAIEQAFLRLTQEELGREISLNDGVFTGVYEHIYPDNFSGDGFSTHYIVLGYSLYLDLSLEQLPVDQHGEYKWWKIDELVESDEVHLHSKWYLDSSIGIRANKHFC